MTLNCIWWWASYPEALENVEYPFISITPRPTLTQSGNTCLGPIYGSNRTSVQSMMLNNIWLWGSSPGSLVNMEYLFIAITPMSTLTQIATTC